MQKKKKFNNAHVQDISFEQLLYICNKNIHYFVIKTIYRLSSYKIISIIATWKWITYHMVSSLLFSHA